MKGMLKQIYENTKVNYNDIIDDLDSKIDSENFEFESFKKELNLLDVKEDKRIKRKSNTKVFFTSLFLAGIILTITLMSYGYGYNIENSNIEYKDDQVIVSLEKEDYKFNEVSQQDIEAIFQNKGYYLKEKRENINNIKKQAIVTYCKNEKYVDIYIEKYSQRNSKISFIGPFDFGKEFKIGNQKYYIVSNSKMIYAFKYNQNKMIYFCGNINQEELLNIIKKIEESD